MKILIDKMLLTLLDQRKCWKDYINQDKIKDYNLFEKNWLRKKKLKNII